VTGIILWLLVSLVENRNGAATSGVSCQRGERRYLSYLWKLKNERKPVRRNDEHGNLLGDVH
jgi:hypothetical protein